MKCKDCAHVIVPVNKIEPLVYRCQFDLNKVKPTHSCCRFAEQFKAPPKEKKK